MQAVQLQPVGWGAHWESGLSNNVFGREQTGQVIQTDSPVFKEALTLN